MTTWEWEWIGLFSPNPNTSIPPATFALSFSSNTILFHPPHVPLPHQVHFRSGAFWLQSCHLPFKWSCTATNVKLSKPVLYHDFLHISVTYQCELLELVFERNHIYIPHFIILNLLYWGVKEIIQTKKEKKKNIVIGHEVHIKWYRLCVWCAVYSTFSMKQFLSRTIGGAIVIWKHIPS